MTNREFSEVCSLLPTDAPISIGYRQFNLTGRLIGCWGDSMVIDFHGLRAIWPRELCEMREATYPIPSYS